MNRTLVLGLVSAALVPCAFAAPKGPQPFHRDSWLVQPVAIPENHPLDKVIPFDDDDDAWKPGAFERNPPQAEGATPGNRIVGDYACWYKKSFAVPADWKGKSVALDFQLLGMNAVVRVNGKDAGVALHPKASVEISRLVNYGGDNELLVFLSNRGYGSGEGPVAYWGRDDQGWPVLGQVYGRKPAVELACHSPARVTDVWVNPSWREKKVDVEIEVTSSVERKAEVRFEISEDTGRDPVSGELGAGKVLKSKEEKVSLKVGVNVVKLSIPWTDAVPWEAAKNPHVYDWEVKLAADGEPCDVPPKSVFGFREIWREGKDIYMNGHIQRFRGWWGPPPKDASDIHAWGFNLNYCTHQHLGPFVEDPKEMERYTRAGICRFTGMPPITFCNSDKVRNDENCRGQWLRYMRLWARSARNYPVVVGASCGVNQVCPERNMRPEMLGQDHEDGGVARNIEFACDLARKEYPNCLFFSHADGTEADLSSSNLYFNFTPLQEREEWLSQWSEKGTLPWYAAEFGAPYQGCWFHARTPQFTEWLATYYGDAAYEAETDEALEYAKDLARICRRQIHGASFKGKGVYELNPLARDYTKKLVYRTNRAWRTFGLNGGIMYLKQWPWDDGWEADAYSQANGDIIAFIGGETAVTDRTHAYWSGAEVKKSLVVQWDGLGENAFDVAWELVTAKGEVVNGGKFKETLRRGEKKLLPIVFKAPETDRNRVSYTLRATFDAAHGMDRMHPANWSCHTDSVPIDVYPPFKAQGLGNPKQVGLFDPEGETAETLESLGIGFTKFDAFDGFIGQAYTNRNPLRVAIVGKRALSNAEGLQRLEKAIAGGLRLIVMQQTAEVWSMLGFKAEDSQARQMYGAFLERVDSVDLNHWAGEPVCEQKFGNVMKHDTRRGPRWTHTHAISAMPLLIPERGGFIPMVRGEFDMSYTALLKLPHGKGAAYFCAFDFEKRVGEGKCPAATRVAQAVFSEVQRGRVSTSRRVVTDGKAAKRLADALGVDSEAYKSGTDYTNALVIVGSDSRLTPKDLAKASEDSSNRIAVFGNDAYVIALGGTKLTREIVGKVDVGNDGRMQNSTNLTGGVAYRLSSAKDNFWNMFRGAKLFSGLYRSRDGFHASRIALTDPKNPLWKVTDRGYAAAFASAKDPKNGKPFFNTYVEMPDPFSVCDRYREIGFKTEALRGQGWGSAPKSDEDLYLRNAAQSEDNSLRRISLIFADWGVPAGKGVFTRSLYTKPYEQFEPLAQYNVLGPFPCPVGDNSEYMVETVNFPVEEGKGGCPGSDAEKFAVAGDVQPNYWFYPQGLKYPADMPKDLHFIDWRPVVKPREDGLVDLRQVPLIASQSFQTSYAVGFLTRETDGEITLRFGVDWRGKVWVNGKELAKTMGGTKDEGSIIVEHVPVFAKPKDLSGEALQAFDKEHGTFDGKNVITVKAGSGMSAAAFYLNVTREIKPGEVVRTIIPELQGIDLYESANPGFDPYEYVYW